MKTADYVRLLLTAVLIVVIFRHAHWSVGIFVVLVTCEIEYRNWRLATISDRARKIGKELREKRDSEI